MLMFEFELTNFKPATKTISPQQKILLTTMIVTQRAARTLPYQRIGSVLNTTAARQASSATASCHLRSLQAIQHHQLMPATGGGQQSQLMMSNKFSHVPTTAKHAFSTHVSQEIATGTRNLGTVTRSLEQLDMSVVKKIEAELREVDANNDGRLDTEELKQLLRKHHAAFTDEEVIELGELYYAGKAGGSMPFQDFIEALDKAAASDNKAIHPILDGNCSAEYIYRKTHASYTPEELDIELTHREPKTYTDKLALNSVKLVRGLFDKATGWKYNDITQDMVMNRVIFLETVAAVPGMVAAIVRHFKSLRSMERDGGLMHVFLEEANNERMHLLSFIKMKDPSTMFRGAVIVSQFGFGSAFLLSYILSPKFCHRFVGYIEEEACTTYTKIVKAIEEAPEGSELAQWRTEVAPSIARGYWKLGEQGTVLDLMYAVRADEAEHRDVNHACSQLEHAQLNPFNDPEIKINQMLKKYVKDVMSRDDKLTPA